jgi:hypothetical protein
MNMANSNYQEQDFDYQADYRRAAKTKPSSKRSIRYSRSNRPVVSHNGIHRRRNKRFTW